MKVYKLVDEMEASSAGPGPEGRLQARQAPQRLQARQQRPKACGCVEGASSTTTTGMQIRFAGWLISEVQAVDLSKRVFDLLNTRGFWEIGILRVASL